MKRPLPLRLSILSLCLLIVIVLAQPQQLGKASAGADHSPITGPQAYSPPDPTIIKNYTVPTPKSGPDGIAFDRNQTLWFTEFQAARIGAFSLQKLNFSTPADYSIPETGAIPVTIAVDGNGLVWFTDQNNKSASVWMFNPSTSTFSAYKTTNPNSNPLFVLVDQQNNIWFTEVTANKIGELSYPNYKMTEYSLPTANSGPAELALQPGTPYIWVTETYANKIARFDKTRPGNSFQEFTPTMPISSPVGIVVDGSGNVWVAEHGGGSVAEFQSSTSTFIKYPTSLPSTGYDNSAPATLSLDKQGRLWFVEHLANRVGRLDPSSRRIDEFAIPTAGEFAFSFLNTLDSNGNFWFTEFNANKIMMVPSSASSSVTFTGGIDQTLAANAGQTIKTQIVVMNNLTVPIQVTLGASSSFSISGQTSQSEVALAPYSLNLNPGDSGTVTVSITPGLTLSSGVYSIGLVAGNGNTSSVAITLLKVTSVLDVTISFLPEIGAAAAAAVTAAFLLMRRRKLNKTKTLGPAPAATICARSLLLFLLFLLAPQLMPHSGVQVEGKCPGLPPPPVNNNFGGDPYTFYVEAASIGLVAVVIAIVLWRIWTQKKS